MDKLGLNPFMQPLNSPVANRKYTSGVDFEGLFEVQARKLNTTQINIKDFIRLSDNALATTPMDSGDTFNFNTTLTPNPPHQSDANFAVPFISIYLGTITANPDPDDQIYPQFGVNVDPDEWIVTGGMDWNAYDGINSVFGGIIKNVSAGPVDIFLVTQWKWLLYNATGNTG